MIDRLMKEAAEEEDQKMFCDTEMEKSRAKQKELSSKVLTSDQLRKHNRFLRTTHRFREAAVRGGGGAPPGL